MAGHMAKKMSGRCIVWNRTFDKAKQHETEFGSIAATNGFSDFAAATAVVLCLPTSAEDASVAQAIAPHLARDSCIVSCTSGEPNETKKLAASLYETFGVHLLDCPVSGGPAGAKAGTLTCMLGANDDVAAEKCIDVVKSFAGKVVRTGPVGSGHAIKAINNVLNVTHLMLAAEGLLALKQHGVSPEVALSVINSSSGRSLQTQERLPKEVLSRNFNYGFRLPLMAKDVRIAEGVLKTGFPQAQILPTAAKLVQEAAEKFPEDADYTRAVCLLESWSGSELIADEPEAKRQKH